MVECQLPKLKVAGSNPVARSFLYLDFYKVNVYNIKNRWRS